ncbi:hypothetical protein [Streptomyces sp. NPDC006971]|uniref:hypothetical protein n=1 Tax=Streptomyces sp. NPDC006971 TaxID=3154784 RepID=UPI0033E8B8A9
MLLLRRVEADAEVTPRASSTPTGDRPCTSAASSTAMAASDSAESRSDKETGPEALMYEQRHPEVSVAPTVGVTDTHIYGAPVPACCSGIA